MHFLRLNPKLLLWIDVLFLWRKISNVLMIGSKLPQSNWMKPPKLPTKPNGTFLKQFNPGLPYLGWGWGSISQSSHDPPWRRTWTCRRTSQDCHRKNGGIFHQLWWIWTVCLNTMSRMNRERERDKHKWICWIHQSCYRNAIPGSLVHFWCLFLLLYRFFRNCVVLSIALGNQWKLAHNKMKNAPMSLKFKSKKPKSSPKMRIANTKRYFLQSLQKSSSKTPPFKWFPYSRVVQPHERGCIVKCKKWWSLNDHHCF